MNEWIREEAKKFIRRAYFEEKRGVRLIAQQLTIKMKEVREIVEEIENEDSPDQQRFAHRDS